MAGRNPTAWRAPLRRQPSPPVGLGRGPSSSGGGTRGGRRRPGQPWATPPQDVRPPRQCQQFGHRRAHPHAATLRRRRAQQRAVEPFVVGAHPERLPDHPGGLAAVAAARQLIGTPQRGAHHQGLDAGACAVEHGPVGPAEAVEERTTDKVHGLDQPAQVVGVGQCGKVLDVGGHRTMQAEMGPARQVRRAVRGPAEGRDGVPRRSSAPWTVQPPGRARWRAPTRRDGRRAGGVRGTRRDRVRPIGGTAPGRRERPPGRGMATSTPVGGTTGNGRDPECRVFTEVNESSFSSCGLKHPGQGRRFVPGRRTVCCDGSGEATCRRVAARYSRGTKSARCASTEAGEGGSRP